MLVIQKSKKRVKKTSLPKEILKIVEEVLNKEEEEIKLVIEEVKKQHKGIWDIKKDDPIEYFDTRISYELTGYRPINKTEGLDFDPSWFTEARDIFLKTGHYTSYRRGTKAFEDFWTKEYRKCIDGLTVNGYTITGDHYFFLNYYQLMDLSSALKAGGGRVYAFPTFYVGQYEWFHYVEMAKRLRLNAFLMKSREVGFSEIDAAIIVNSYNSIKNSFNLITAHSSDHLDKTLEKVWRAISFINDYTDGGFTKLSLVVNSLYKRRASRYETIGGVKIETGWMSLITGIVADKPSKIRGDRVDLLVYEESGCHIAGTEVLMYNGSFKKVEDILLGDILMGDDGTPRNVIELHTGVDQMYKISPEYGDTLIVNSNHILYGEYYNPLTKTYQEFTIKTKDFYKLTNKENYYLINVKNSRIRVKFSIDESSIDNFYGFSLDGNLLFVLKDFTVCHNSWPGLIKAFILSNALVGQPGSQWGYRIGGGTGGEKF